MSFAYEGRKDGVFEGLEVCIPPSSTVVVSGTSGSGKSTLLKLLARELEPSRGGILFGDVPLQEIAEEDLRDHLAFVSQDEHLFDATVGENLRLAKPEATDEELMEVLEVACLTGLIGGLTEGLATRIGEHGRELSGGQRSRLCAARALLRHPELLLLDEPTEGVDRATAREVMVRLRRFLPASTLVVATHDPTLVTETFAGVVRMALGAGAPVPAAMRR